MADYLQRDQAPLSTDEWAKLDELVIGTARQQLVGRRILDIFGPLGVGQQFVPCASLGGVTPAAADATGEGGTPIAVVGRSQVPLTMVYKDFVLSWRDMEAARAAGLPLDFAAAAAAAAMCAAREDELIFHGDKALGVEGLCTATGRRTMVRRDWGIEGHAFLDVVTAIEHMVGAGFYPPYALVCSPNLYACLLRIYGNSGVMELNQVRELCTAGVFQSVHVKSAVLIATGAHNVDLAIGQDMTVGYLQSENMNHTFRVMETLALRIKRAGAICSMTPRSAVPGQRTKRGVPEEATGLGD